MFSFVTVIIVLSSIVICCTFVSMTKSIKNIQDGTKYRRNSVFCESVSTGSNYDMLYNYLTGTGAHNFNESVTIGFLGAYGQAQVVLGALPLAVEAVNRDKSLLPGRKLRYIAANIGTNPTASGLLRRKSSQAARAIRAMTEMRDNGTIAFIGPDDTCYSEALVAAAWNLPMISYKCSDTKVSDKRVFYTFARTLPPSSKVSKSVVALLKAFQWTKFVMVSGSHPASGSEVQEAIEELSEIHGLTVTETRLYTDYIPRHIEQMDKIISDTFARTRVYVFVGEHIALIDFIKCLQRRKLLETGDYVVISVDDEIYDPNRKIKIIQRDYLDPFLNESWGNVSDYLGFRSVLKLTPSHQQNHKYKFVCENIKSFSAKPPFCVPYHAKIFNTITVPVQAAYLYDAIMIYAKALTEVFQDNEDPRNGTAILSHIVNRSYTSIQGYDVYIDKNGDAEGNFTVVALMDDNEMNGSLRMSMQPVGYFQYSTIGSTLSSTLPVFKYVDSTRPIQWVGGKQPKAEPPCGFEGTRCMYKPDIRLIIGILMFTIVLMLAALFILKHYRYEQKLACFLWKIDMKDVTLIPTDTSSDTSESRVMAQVCRHRSIFQGPSNSIVDNCDSSPKRAYTNIGIYRGNIVAIKQVHKKSIDLTRSLRKELKQIRDIRHENLNLFIGASVDHGQIAILNAYCARGSLEDILNNEDLHLDNMFISSLVTDLLKGLIYLHDSEIISHGNLHSRNCLVDGRWVLQISDFGLHEFKAGQEIIDPDNKYPRKLLWRAPELLRDPNPPSRGSQKGDVYSFAIILYEILGRAGPWGGMQYTTEEIVEKVKKEPVDVPFRPSLERFGSANYITKCIKACWHEEVDMRPDIRYVRILLKEMQSGLKPNIFDNMLAIMEKYAYNLEGLVQERTTQLMEEKKKTDALLNRMLPKSVADSLKRGEKVQAESFDIVTIYFSDIVGFTELSAVSTPLQVIDLLNDLYTCFDSIISHYDVYKIETIGDAYMVVSGLPIKNGNLHAGEIASMALHLLGKIKKFEIKHRPGETLQLRIGIHSGQCVAGVVGLKMPRYCLFGDTVNTASRMESSGAAFKIHISQATYNLLQRLGGYRFEERGFITIKGKGEMLTYWLVAEEPGRRLARIREGILGGSLLSSLSSDRLSETPDLLRRPSTKVSDSCLLPQSSTSSLFQLHYRAREAYSIYFNQTRFERFTLKYKLSAVIIIANMASNNTRRRSEIDKSSDENFEHESPYYLRSKRFKGGTCDAGTSTRIVRSYERTACSYRSQKKLMELPDELLRSIFKYIDFETLAAVVRLVNKRSMHIVQNILNVSFMSLDKHFVDIKRMLNFSLEHVKEDLEFKGMCKLLNVLETVHFHYSIIKASIWRYTGNYFRSSNIRCMYAGTILDICYRLCRHFTTTPDKIYYPLLIRDYLPEDVREICQQAKMFTLCFDRISELPVNKSVFISGAKVVDILDCAFQAKREVLHRKQIGNTLFLKLKYYFSNSWFIALDIQEDKSKDWQEQMRLLYMRIRRIVVSHTEMNLEYAQVKRENELYNNIGYRLRSPINSVYTGFGEVEDKFFFYGVMNKGAYQSKFQDSRLHQEFEDLDGAESDDSAQSTNDSSLGLTITVTLRCPMQLAPLVVLEECHQTPVAELDDSATVAKRLRGLFDMQIEFSCPAGDKARLPTKYIGHIKGRR